MTSLATRWTSYLSLPLIIFFEGLSWYLTRAGLAPYLMNSGMEANEAVATLEASSYAGLAGLLVAGALAIPFGPAMPMAVGALLMLLSLLALAALPPESAASALVVAALGHALLRPAVWGACARAFGRDHPNLRASLMVLIYVSANGAAALASGLSARFGDRIAEPDAQRAAFETGAGLEAVVLLLVAVLGVVLFLKRGEDGSATSPQRKTTGEPEVSDEEAAGDQSPPRVLALGVSLGILGISGLTAGFALIGWDLAFTLMGFDDPIRVAGLLATNTTVVITVGLLTASVLAALHLAQLRLPLLMLAGIGLVGSGVAMVALLLIDPTETNPAGLVGVMMLLGVGEVFWMPMLFSAVTAELPWKLETAVIGLYLIASRLPGLARGLGDDHAATVRNMTWLGVAMVLPLGIAMVAAAFPLRRILDPGRESRAKP